MSEKRSLPRSTAVDAVKAFAIFGVVIIHTCMKGYTAPLLSFDWFSTMFIRSAVSASVPLFFMCTGALFLDERKAFSTRRLFTRNLPRMLIALFFWALLYKAYNLLIDRMLTSAAWLHAVKELLTFQHQDHLYFLHIMLIVYPALPIVRFFSAHASGKELGYLLGFWFLFGILYPTVKDLWPFTLVYGIPRQ